MKTRIMVAAVGLPAVFVILVVLKPIFLMTALVAMLEIAAVEMYRAVSARTNSGIFAATVIAAAAVPVLTYIGQDEAAFYAIIMLLLAYDFLEAIIAYEGGRKVSLENILLSIVAGFIIPFLLSTMLILKMHENGAYLTVMVCVITMVSDSGGYFIGCAIGKHHITPKVSPKKSLEGYIGSFLSAIVGMMVYGLLISRIGGFDVNYLRLLAYAVCGNIFTQLGDLSFSLIKRHYNIKDFGDILPGHGGILDRFDSMIFTAPVVFVLYTLLPAF